MGWFLIEEWAEQADGFGAYFGMLARMSALRVERGVVYLRRPLSGLAKMPVRPGTVALVCAVIGTTTFDGLSNHVVWRKLEPHLQGRAQRQPPPRHDRAQPDVRAHARADRLRIRARHYFSLLIWQGHAIGYLASDPLGNGANLFGTSSYQIDYSIISFAAIWYVQVAALVAVT